MSVPSGSVPGGEVRALSKGCEWPHKHASPDLSIPDLGNSDSHKATTAQEENDGENHKRAIPPQVTGRCGAS